MKRAIITPIILIALILSPALRAQTLPSQPSKDEEEKARQELERRTLQLLEEVVSDAQTLKLMENRVIVEASAADLLWPRDEKRARTFFRNALTGLAEAYGNASDKSASRLTSDWMLIQLRYQLLRMVARRDPQLALDLLALSRPPAREDGQQISAMQDQELMLEQSLAAETVASDPKRALQMAEESLSKGVSGTVLSLLRRLQQKDADAAQKFLSSIIRKLQTENFQRNSSAAFVAQELLQAALRQQEPAAQKSPPPSNIKPLSFDDRTRRELAEMIVRGALDASASNPSLFMLKSMLPDLERLVPERAEQLRARVAEAQKMLDPETRKWFEYESILNKGTADAILEAAAKASPEMRAPLYSVAASKLMEAGDTERARQVITENLPGEMREQALARLDQRAVARSLEQGKLDEARQLISRIPSKHRRAAQIALLVTALAKKGERKMALELLEETKNLINRQPENQQEIFTLLAVARAYAAVDPPRAFELIEPVVDQANEMISAAALLDKFGSGQGMFRKGEMVLHPGFLAANTTFAQYARELGTLARADFLRTKSVADKFQRNEVRLMARLLIAQSVLSDRQAVQEEDDAPFGATMVFGSSQYFSTFDY